jgi:hypothetical protein
LLNGFHIIPLCFGEYTHRFGQLLPEEERERRRRKRRRKRRRRKGEGEGENKNLRVREDGVKERYYSREKEKNQRG